MRKKERKNKKAGRGSPYAAAPRLRSPRWAEGGREGGREGERRGKGRRVALPPPSTSAGSIFPPAAPLQLSAPRGRSPAAPPRSAPSPHGPTHPGLTGIILGPNRMGAAGAGPAARSGRPATREAEALRYRRDARGDLLREVPSSTRPRCSPSALFPPGAALPPLPSPPAPLRN